MRVGNLMADMLLQRMGGEVAVVTAGHAFTGPLPAGTLSRGTLWDVCNTTANPALVEMSGAQLVALVTKGLDLALPPTARTRCEDTRAAFCISAGQRHKTVKC